MWSICGDVWGNFAAYLKFKVSDKVLRLDVEERKGFSSYYRHMLVSSSVRAALSYTKMPSSTPINLVSVNTAPERAKKVIEAVIEQVKNRYNLVHAGNAESECG